MSGNPSPDHEALALARILATWRGGGDAEDWAVDMYTEPADLILAWMQEEGYVRADDWEYGIREVFDDGEVYDEGGFVSTNLEAVRQECLSGQRVEDHTRKVLADEGETDDCHVILSVVRRRPAGPWEVVPNVE